MIDTRALVDRLHRLESVAIIPRVTSTNLVARRILDECLDNELSLPQAIIIAGEQFAGRGRNERTWSSPAGKGIYATVLVTRPASELPLFPLEIASAVATYLRDTFAVDARIKWPNDILANGRKIAGLLIEARVQADRVHMLVGIGVNLEPFESDTRPNATSVRELGGAKYAGIDDAVTKFVEHLDQRLNTKPTRVLDEWRELSVHKAGDRIASVIGDRTIEGTWSGIDEHGRALIQSGGETIAVSAGDIVLTTTPPASS